LPGGTEIDVRWSDVIEQSEAYVDCQDCPEPSLYLHSVFILIMSPVMILRTPTDIFPSNNIPVVAVA
jgi:hypothetical protein